MGRKKSRSPAAQQAHVVSNNHGPIGPPRFDKYSKLIKRFYEHLLVLYEYDSVRGEHTAENPEPGLGRFLDDLAFLCEYEKGGNACTAIGVQDSEELFIFWVAANFGSRKKIVPFLESLLKEFANLSQTSSAATSDHEHRLKASCINYARLKIKALKDLLLRAVSDCHSRTQNPIFALWREQFNSCPSDVAVCELAYRLRNSDEIKTIEVMAQEPTYLRSSAERKSPFGQVRHYVGRLAHYVRVVRRLIQDINSVAVRDLITNPFRVEAVPLATCVDLPRPDNLTTLDGICTRMLEAHDPFLDQLKREFANRNIVEKIMAHYENCKTPRVHAEIQVLDFFHIHGIRWARDDRPKEPQSHQKVWPMWGPMLLKSQSEDARYVEQRDILNSIINDIRRELIDQIKAGHGRHSWHEDTRTDITRSTADAKVEHPRRFSLRLSDVRIDSSDGQDDPSNTDSETNSSEQHIFDVEPVSTDIEHEGSYSSDTSTDEDYDSDGGALL
ncbi:hypothetical protein TruAng_008441 [Truncatella angustata]|nr:hypothetical protein TruAng_008441 [Truncatella angustata]